MWGPQRSSLQQSLSRILTRQALSIQKGWGREAVNSRPDRMHSQTLSQLTRKLHLSRGMGHTKSQHWQAEAGDQDQQLGWGNRMGEKVRKRKREEERGEGKWDTDLMLCERGLDFCLGSEVNWKYCFSLKEGWLSKESGPNISRGLLPLPRTTKSGHRHWVWCRNLSMMLYFQAHPETYRVPAPNSTDQMNGDSSGREQSVCFVVPFKSPLGDLQSKGLRSTREVLTKTWSPWACWEWQSQL